MCMLELLGKNGNAEEINIYCKIKNTWELDDNNIFDNNNLPCTEILLVTIEYIET